MKTIKSVFSKKNLIESLVITILLLVMATPVLANSYNWGWTSNDYGMIIDGKRNGITYNLTAGTMTLQGGVTIIEDTSFGLATWRHTVKKVNLLIDSSVCSVSVTPELPGVRYPFSKNCGSQPAATYYLYIERLTSTGESDYRIVTGSGTISTQ